MTKLNSNLNSNLNLKKLGLLVGVALTLSACKLSDSTDVNYNSPTTTSTSTGPVKVSGTTSSSTKSTTTPTSTSTSNLTAGATFKVSDLKKDIIKELSKNNGEVVTDEDFKLTVKLGNRSYGEGTTVNLSNHFTKNQVTNVNGSLRYDYEENGGYYYEENDFKMRGYRQDYSFIAGGRGTGTGRTNNPNVSENEIKDALAKEYTADWVKGQATANSALPTTGTYNYSGVAFTENEAGGKLSYDVNFDNRVGSGQITGLNEYGKITLNQGTIGSVTYDNSGWDGTATTSMGIQSTATAESGETGNYKLGFFGPNAEEIVGSVEDVVGFGGKRGSTAK